MMIPYTLILNFEHLPRNYLVPLLQKNYSRKDLLETRNEIYDIRDKKNRIKFINLFNVIEDILEDRVPEVIILE